MFFGDNTPEYFNTGGLRTAVEYDTTLTNQQKQSVDFLLNGGSGLDNNVTSGSDIAAAAVKGGAGLIAGYGIANVLGGLAGLDSKPLAALSVAGGIGTAIVSSGIFDEEFSVGSFLNNKYASIDKGVEMSVDKEATMTESLMSVLVGLPFAVGGAFGIAVAALTKDTKANAEMLELGIQESESREALLESESRMRTSKKAAKRDRLNTRRAIRM